MKKPATSPWTRLEPRLGSAAASRIFITHARALSKLSTTAHENDAALEKRRRAYVEGLAAAPPGVRQALLAAGLVTIDLAVQGWGVRVRRGIVEVQPPIASSDAVAEKARVRRQELVKRDAQLRGDSVRRFIATMEQPRTFEGKLVSIFSLMRDGRDLASTLREARASATAGSDLTKVIDPYLEFVRSDTATCHLTGLRLMDVWRYFRHTWANQYKSVPGRTMVFLVRDRAAPFHPVVGLGALSSPVMQIRERDLWVGWHPDAFLSHLRNKPTVSVAHWLTAIIDTAIDEIYVDDLVEDEILSRRDLTHPSAEALVRLQGAATAEREKHNRFTQAKEHKRPKKRHSDDRWATQARTHLFRSKRAQALATYLRARAALLKALGDRPTPEKILAFAESSSGSDIIRGILKKARADRVGIAVADISVCGAIPPYNPILGGKCVAMLAASPEVSLEYRRRYSKAESEIASSMAGRAIIRAPALVLLGTTSLYGVGSSQYNRINIPCASVGGDAADEIRYAELGHSESYGTSQFSEETVAALVDLVQQSAGGQRVNSIFGEGHSPKLRKVRQGLDQLGLPSGDLLRHHRHRVVYAVNLVRNLREYLLGIDRSPVYLLPLADGPAATSRIAEWWRYRWLRGRIQSDDVLNAVAEHTLVRPIQHGARVVLPGRETEGVVP